MTVRRHFPFRFMLVFLCLILLLGLAPSTALTTQVYAVNGVIIGPGALPDWHDEAQVQLGWVFADPTNPGDSNPLEGWDRAIGEIPLWSYDPDRIEFEMPAQWYIRIPNLIQDNRVKKFWISWVYEFDFELQGLRSATNFTWDPGTGAANYQYLEELFDMNGDPTEEHFLAAYARVTISVDMYPNPYYEDIWLGTFPGTDGGVKHAVEVYIKTFCVTTPGDANGDGVINVLDMTKVARIILLLDAETPGADANLDGAVNVLDITKIARIILGLD